jgi:hypothetical protein
MAEQQNGAAVLASAHSAGNEEVIKILAKYLAEARKGNGVAIGIVLVTGADGVRTEYGGAAGFDFAMNFGIDYLKDAVIQGFVESQHRNARGITPARSPLIIPQG